MAALDTTRAPFHAANRGLISTFVASTIALINSWNDERRTRHALEGLSDHELEDIGLCRGDIDTLARSIR